MPRKAAASSSSPSREILEAALQGLELQRSRLDEQIAEIRRHLGGRGGSSSAPAGKKSSSGGGSAAASGSTDGGKRTLSEEARKRIAAAQKKRWANFRKSSK